MISEEPCKPFFSLVQPADLLSLDALIRGLLLIYIAVLPFKELLIVERNGFLVLLGLLVLWCLIHRRFFFPKTPFDAPLVTFVCWVGLTIPFSVFPEYSLKEFGKLLQQLIIFYAVVQFLSYRFFRQVLFTLIGSLTLAISVKGLSQYDLDYPQAVVSFFPAEVWLTTFLVMVIPLAIATCFVADALWIRAASLVTMLMAVACLVSTQSRAGLLSLIAEFWATTWLVRTRSSMLLAGILSLGLVVGFLVTLGVRGGTGTLENGGNHFRMPFQTTVNSIIHRFDIWAFTLSEIQKHWLTGIGYGKDNFLKVYGQEEETPAIGHATVKKAGTHNILLYLALHIGIPGMFIFCWLYFSVVRKTISESRMPEDWLERAILCGVAGGIIGLAVRLQFDHMFVGSLAVFFWVLVALAVLSYSPPREVGNMT